MINSSVSRKKGLTLLEMMIVMSVIALLSTLGIQQAIIVQRNARDKERLATGASMVDFINDFRRKNSFNYPEKSNVSFSEGKLQITNKNAIDILTGNTYALQETYTLKRYTTPGTKTDSTQTLYYYDSSRGEFALCILLESKDVKSLGLQSCPDVSKW